MKKVESKISVRNLHKSFGDQKVLSGLDLDLYPSESLVVIGGSGTGKSVLIKCILGLLKPDKGKISIDGIDVTSLPSSKWQKQISRFGMLFQGSALFDSMTVWENIAFALIQGQGMDRKEAHKLALEKLAAVNLSPETADLYPAELSGGMQKRVALARAIAANPEVIFFDEPTTGLDPIIGRTINDLIRKCVKDLGTSAITITHDVNSVRRIADRVGLLFQGRLIWTGSVTELDKTDNPYVQQFIHGNPQGPYTTGS